MSKQIPRITKCESIAKMTNDEVKIMILQERITSVITYLDMAIEVNEDFLQHYDDEPTILTTEQKRFEKIYILNEINVYKKIREMLVGGENNE